MILEAATTRFWVERSISADPDDAWQLLVDVERWPLWGPSVRAAALHGERFDVGATGWVRTSFGIRLPFVVTSVEDGRRWSWSVAGVPATDHRVRPSSAGCTVGFGVPRLAAPYALVCRRALVNIDRLLTA